MRVKEVKRGRPRGATAHRRKPRLRLHWPAGRWLKPLGIAVALLGLAALGLRAVQQVELPVRTVSLQGQFRYLDAQALEQAMAPLLRDGLLAVSLGELRRTLESLPWVERALIKRKWPDELTVVVVEQVPIAWWGEDRLINHRGEPFSPAGATLEQSLPRLEGPEGAEVEVMQRYFELQSVLGKRDLEVRPVSLNALGGWNVTLKSDVELVFGRRKLTEKLQRFLAVYDRELHEYLAQAERVDLRYQNGLAVRWRHQPASSLASGDAGV